MSTGLVTGMKLGEAAGAVADAAAALLKPGQAVAVHTETGGRGVMVGVAIPGGCCAIMIDRAEYDGLKLAQLLCDLEAA